MKNIGTKQLETERLILRKITKEDAKEAYTNWCSLDSTCKYVFWPKHKSPKETEELYSIWENEYSDPTTYRWVVELKDTHELIGTIDNPSKTYMEYDVMEVGYCYGEKYWGKGYATEALKRVIKFFFEEVEAEVVFAKHMHNNPGSGVVMQKSGLKYEGIQRGRMIDKDNVRNDLISYSLTKEEYYTK